MKNYAEKMFATVVALFVVAIASLLSVSSYAQTVNDFKGGYTFMVSGNDKAAYVKKVASAFDVKITNSKKEDPVKGFYIKNDTKDSLGVFVAITEDDLTMNGKSADPAAIYNTIITKGKERIAVTAKKEADKEAKKLEAEQKKAEREAKAEAKRQERIAKGLPAEPTKKTMGAAFKAALN